MRILAVSNLYPNPFQPNRATFNRQQFRAIAATCPMHVISPIAWTDEFRMPADRRAAMPVDRRVELDGITVDHPRYWFPPKVLRSWYGKLFEKSIRPTFQRAVRDFRPDVVLGSWAYPD